MGARHSPVNFLTSSIWKITLARAHIGGVMQMWKALGVGLALVVVYFSAAQAKSICPATPQQCTAHKIVRTPSGAIAISNICDLQAIPADATDSYELTQDIDATCTAKWNAGRGFTSIGGSFAGKLDGHGHWIHAIKIQGATGHVGTFDQIAANGIVQNLGLTDVDVSDGNGSPYAIGGIAAINLGSISFAFVDGCVSNTSQCSAISNDNVLGGLVGDNEGVISGSFFKGTSSEVAGGIAGVNGGNVYNSCSSAVMRVPGAGVGGLLGANYAIVDSSCSLGDVEIGAGGYGGGLLGVLYGSVSDSYSSATVGGGATQIGGLQGLAGDYHGEQIGPTTTAYSVGRVDGAGQNIGGLVGYSNGTGAFSDDIWDSQTSNQSGSAGGTPKTTEQLKAELPPGFDSGAWSLVPGVSYPFQILYNCSWSGAQASNCMLPSFFTKTRFPLRDPNCVDPDGDDFFCLVVPPIMSFFEPPLAQFTASRTQFGKHAGVYTILPIGQLQLFDYTKYGNAEATVDDDNGNPHPAAKLACFGTVYTMIARLIGQIYPEAKVVTDVGTPNMCHKNEFASAAHIDCLLEDSGNLVVKGTGIWPTSLQKYATFGSFAPLDDGTVKKLIESGQLAIIYGTAGGLVHVMLITSEIKDSSGNVVRFVANDPELGMQVFIDTNKADGTAYHRAVMRPLGTGNPNEYKTLSGFDFNATKYKAITWQKMH